MPYDHTLTSSSVHHLSHQWTTPFLSYYIVTQMKSDAKQQFTTATTTIDEAHIMS